MAKDENRLSAPEPSNVPVKKAKTKKRGFKKSIAKWFREMRSELKKVVWPTPKQIAKNTGVSLFFMAIAAVVLWGFDSVASAAVRVLITFLG